MDVWYDEQVQGLRDLYGETEKFYKAKEALDKLYAAKSKEIDEERKNDLLSNLFSIGAAASNFFAQLNSLSRTNFNNQMTAIDKEADARMQEYDARIEGLDEVYEAEREKIENSLMNEQEKEAALKVLEAEKNKALKEAEEEKAKAQMAFEAKRKAVQKAAFESEKKGSLVMAGINIAEAFTKALTGAIPPFNFALAALVAAAGAVQIAAIAGQTFPGYKEGGYVPMDTVAHLHAGEYVMNASDVRAMTGTSTERIHEGAASTFLIDMKVNIYAQRLDDRTIDQAGEKLYAAINRQKNRFGR